MIFVLDDREYNVILTTLYRIAERENVVISTIKSLEMQNRHQEIFLPLCSLSGLDRALAHIRETYHVNPHMGTFAPYPNGD